MASDGLVSFGDLLRRARRAAGLTHEELAERAGLSVRGISDLERGVVRAPRRDTLELLGAALELSETERRQWDQLRRERAVRPQRTGLSKLSSSSATGNLPTPLTTLVGRADAARAVAEMFASSRGRLVTITGPGGVGKTRLAIEVGQLLQGCLSGGAWFVDLAPLTKSESVIPAIASTLGVVARGRQPRFAALTEHLRQSENLLVLDNFEHIVDSAPTISQLLLACPTLSMLVTSRVALRIRGEQEYPLAPLPVVDAVASESDIRENPSTVLFKQRAEAVQPDFRITRDNIEAIAEICRRLDGLPLALELAAARIRVLPPKAMLARMEPSLPLLVGAARDLPDRQRTLRATIQWSYDLLSDDDKQLFRVLSIFRGGWTLEAAEAIGGSKLDVLAGLQALIDHSLIHTVEQPDDTARYRMLEIVREFAFEHLSSGSERSAVERRFIRFFRQFAESANAEIHGPSQASWLAALASESGNLRSALQLAREKAEDGDREAIAEMVRLTSALWWFWYIHGAFAEGTEQVGAAIQLFRDDPTARSLADQDDDVALAYAGANFGLGGFQIFGQLDEADYRIFFVEYERTMAESVAIYRRLKRQSEIAYAYTFVGFAAQNGGYFEEAEAYFLESVELYRSLDDPAGVAFTLLGYGEMEWRRRDYPRAIDLLSESLETFESLGDLRGIAASMGTLGGTYLRLGQLDQAGELLRESLRLRQQIGDLGGLPWNLEHLAELSMAGLQSGHDATRAARLLGAAKAIRDRTGSWIYLADQPDHEGLLGQIRQNLSEIAFAAAWETGRAMTLDRAVAYALEPDVGESGSRPARPSLSRREREVLGLLVEGRTNQEIADVLFISPHTSASHVKSILNKLGVDSRTAAATWAVKEGIV